MTEWQQQEINEARLADRYVGLVYGAEKCGYWILGRTYSQIREYMAAIEPTYPEQRQLDQYTIDAGILIDKILP